MEGAWCWIGEAFEAQGDWEGSIGHAAGQDAQDLRQSLRLVLVDDFMIVILPD